MDISYYLLENPWPVAGLLIVAGVLAVAVWFARRQRPALFVAGGLIVAAGLVTLLAFLVQTDREQVNDNLAAICRDAEQGRMDAAQTYMDEHVSTGIPFVGKKELLAMGRSALDNYHPKQLMLMNVQTLVAGKNATTTAGMLVEVPGYGFTPLQWRFQWAKRPEGWRMTRVQRVGKEDLNSWQTP